jgi:hypothetical protein
MKKFLFFLILAGMATAFTAATIKARQYRDQAMEADSVAAARDTARMLALAALDSTENAWQLRIVQTELEADSLDRELRARPVVRVAAGIRIDTLKITDTVQVAVEDTTEVYQFHGSDGPFAFQGDARLFPDRHGVFNVAVALSQPVPVNVTIHCQGNAGVRSASVLLTADDPFSVVPESVQQDPAICNPPMLPVFNFTKNRAVWGAVGIGIGWVGHMLLDGDGKSNYNLR